ncbi:hypothetical protein C8J57DRAFT_5427 [Mycena rebaudengoi]|nr:hypothetical protein C8J57DRAFT_5427 [Mycena rebaudengoi]
MCRDPPRGRPKGRTRCPPFLPLFAAAAGASPLPRHENQEQAFASPFVAPTRTHRRIPPRYSEGPDGTWRRIPSYSLYGSTFCSTCTTKATAVVDAAVTEDIVENLPSGWYREVQVTNKTRTSITVAFSLILASLICITIALLWRRGHGPRRDIEARKHKHKAKAKAKAAAAAAVDAANVGNTTTINSKKSADPRKWMARATARWRDNARYLARQRRGRRQTARRSVESLVLSRSRSISLSIHESRAQTPTQVSPTASSLSLASIASTASSIALVPPNPPAYLPPPPTKEEESGFDAHGPFADTDLSGIFPFDIPLPHTDDDDDDEAHPPYVSSSDTPTTQQTTAHLATDDKSVLARLAECVLRAGPARGSGSGGAPTGVCVAAADGWC